MCEHLIRKLQFLATAEDATGMNDSAIAMREAATALERLRKDAERLDLLDRLAEAYGFEDTLEGYRWCVDGPFKSIREAADAIRPAIDAAIAQEKGGVMKITKVEIAKSNRVWIGKCRSCLSEAEAIESEMTHISSDQRDGGRFSWEKCPVCEAGADSGYGGMLFYPRTATTQERQP